LPGPDGKANVHLLTGAAAVKSTIFLTTSGTKDGMSRSWFRSLSELTTRNIPLIHRMISPLAAAILVVEAAAAIGGMAAAMAMAATDR
jgi:hypothetical protein